MSVKNGRDYETHIKKARDKLRRFLWWSHGEGVRRGGLFPLVLGKYSSELDIYAALLVHRSLCSIPNKIPKPTNQEG